MLIPTSFGPEESEFVALTHLAKNANMKQSQYMHLTNQMEVSCCPQLEYRACYKIIQSNRSTIIWSNPLHYFLFYRTIKRHTTWTDRTSLTLKTLSSMKTKQDSNCKKNPKLKLTVRWRRTCRISWWLSITSAEKKRTPTMFWSRHFMSEKTPQSHQIKEHYWLVW